MSPRIMPIYASLTAERFLAIEFGEEKTELAAASSGSSPARPSATSRWRETS
ncbi:hypothetical protein [Sphingomonas phyllosphaerae]|uniref:hypothetical protein n=1 Tax=Sphingomonas phyllosphaerae TaxID=257003 RepID=UPI002413AFC8|nr:hypothetical protein [Sphingomonas phyllosphaerae]